MLDRRLRTPGSWPRALPLALLEGHGMVNDVADFLAGFVAAEGCFAHSGARFRLAVALADDDVAGVELLRAFTGVGTICRSPPRSERTKGAVIWAVQSRVELLDVVVPWLDDHLAPCHKRQQYEAWRAALLVAGRPRSRRAAARAGARITT